MTLSAVLSFAAVVGLLTLTPGMDTALILRTAAIGEPRRAWGVVSGIQTGTLVWGALTSAGVTALLTASHIAYEALRWAGACYLTWMGLTMLWATFRRRGTEAARGTDAARPPAEEAGNAFLPGWRRGALTNLLNPKVGVFYVALLPQFIPAGAPVFAAGLLLTSIHIVFGTAWSTVLVLLARRMRRVLRRPLARRLLDRITGTVIAGFGVRLALSDR